MNIAERLRAVLDSTDVWLLLGLIALLWVMKVEDR